LLTFGTAVTRSYSNWSPLELRNDGTDDVVIGHVSRAVRAVGGAIVVSGVRHCEAFIHTGQSSVR
jgi:hypothetical protein